MDEKIEYLISEAGDFENMDKERQLAHVNIPCLSLFLFTQTYTVLPKVGEMII